MLNHPSAKEGQALFAMLYANDPPPPGLPGRLRARGFKLMRSDDAFLQQAGIMLHGMAEAAESRRAARRMRHG